MDSPSGETETFCTLLDLPGIRLEQIVSNSQASAEGFQKVETPAFSGDVLLYGSAQWKNRKSPWNKCMSTLSILSGAIGIFFLMHGILIGHY